MKKQIIYRLDSGSRGATGQTSGPQTTEGESRPDTKDGEMYLVAGRMHRATEAEAPNIQAWAAASDSKSSPGMGSTIYKGHSNNK